ncbi:MAG: hypothetical protein ACRC5S_03130 [Cetobacterium sp.]|uniref:hypothetical protein n=1 Tax=Cetobacterium somerae TaxID=188913 RepID=UPI002E7BFA0A|nr:hypothetical protein [Cetobacterium somerae]WVJ02987.1 hypothetical protein VSU16_14750 [Cetobacterium somerae]
MKKPLLDKFKDINNIEVIKIQKYEFSIKPINHRQAKYLDNYYPYLHSNCESAIIFLRELLIDDRKLDEFLNDYTPVLGDKDDKTRLLINAVCIEILGIRPRSFDYAFKEAVETIIEKRSIMDQFITVLVGFGYKVYDINNLSNLNIISLTLEELYYRDKKEFLIFVSKITGRLKLPLMSTLDNVIYKYISELKFEDSEPGFVENIKNLLNDSVNESQQTAYKLKTQNEMFASIPE